jgi:hypothetical protein
MTEETLKELIEVAKKAMKAISVAGLNQDLVFEIRDLIRKIEAEKV